MTKQQLLEAYNIAIKYGFCFDCGWKLDSEQCHECDCYVRSVSIIQDVMKRAYKECEQE